MTAAIEHLLRDVQSAVAVRHLYAADHPRSTQLVTRIAEQANALAAQRDISVFALDSRVVFDGAALPNSEVLARGLFATLARRGHHRVTFTAGLTAAEVDRFVGALVEIARKADAETPLPLLPHIKLTSLDTPDPPPAPRPAAVGNRATLGTIWTGVVERRRLDADLLDVVALSLVRQVEQRGGGAIVLSDAMGADYVSAHVSNMALLAMALGETLGFSPALVKTLAVSVLLHDVGKLCVPCEVLEATGTLTPLQRELIRRHPEDGARMLLATPGVPDLAVVVAYEHHLQYDGGGYPSVPRGWRVNLASAITHLCDVYDALRADRPYRRGLSPERIATVMTRDAGTVFDPALLEIFFDVVVPRTTSAGTAA